MWDQNIKPEKVRQSAKLLKKYEDKYFETKDWGQEAIDV